MTPSPRTTDATRGPSREPDLPPWKKILYSSIIIAAMFGLLELALLAAGVRPVIVDEDPFVGFAGNLPLFVETTDADGNAVLATAPNKRLFNRQQFPAQKGLDTYRIFCLGGSTTFGRPFDDTSSFAGWLRELLPLVAPDRQWEVVNAGGTSYASYRVARLMEELVDYEPDLFNVYTGQNEFLEERTYRGLRATPEIVRSVSAVLARTRTWAALTAAVRGLDLAPEPTAEGKTTLNEEADTLIEHFGPEVYKRDGALRSQIRDHFRLSLERMVRLADAAGTDLALVTPASNLKDCSPFKSEHTDGLDATAISRSKELGAAAAAALAAGDAGAALAMLEEAIAIDPRYAEHHYRRGKTLVAMGHGEDARAAFWRAVAEDVCPLRVLPAMQRDVAAVAAAHDLPVVDFDALVTDLARAETGLPIAGKEYFLDHVHPTIRAHGLLARELAGIVLDLAGRPSTEPSKEHLALAGQRIEARLGPAERARSLANLAAVLAWAGKLEDAVGPAHQALAADTGDATTVARAAGILASWYATSGDLERERLYYRMTLNAEPGNPDTHWRIGLRALDRQPPEVELACTHITYAAVYWQGAQRDAPHRVLGSVLASRGQTAAFTHLLEARKIDPGNPETLALLDQVGRRLGAATGSLDTPKFTVEEYPSGAIRSIIQVMVGPDGRAVADGIWTEWHEGGEPRRYREMAAGAPRGADVAWDAEGRELSRRP